MTERDFQYNPATHPIEPRATDLSKNNSLWLAAAANLAYTEKVTIEPVAKEWGFDKVEFVTSEDKEDRKFDTQAFVAANTEVLLIAFRGTENIKDWTTNLKFKPIDGPAGQIHRGFYTAAVRAWDDHIRSLVDRFQTQDQPIWITGHSLGGALAVATAAYLQLDQNINVQGGVYTFGQPRVGNRAFASAFNNVFMNRAFHYVNNNDLVPHVPPIGFVLNYWHTELALYFDSDGNLHRDIPLWRMLTEGARGVFKDIGNPGPDALNDHNMDHYIDLVRRQVNA